MMPSSRSICLFKSFRNNIINQYNKSGLIGTIRIFHYHVSSRMFGSALSYNILKMPALSPTMTSGTISQWLKQPGDKLSPGDIICEVETDKATVAYEVQDEGILAKILIDAKSKEVSVGCGVAVIVDDHDAYSNFLNSAKDGSLSLDTLQTSQQQGKKAETTSPSATLTLHTQSSRTVSDEFLLSPSARHLAANRNINVSQLSGSGKGGRITKSDVILALKQGIKFPSAGQKSHSQHEKPQQVQQSPQSQQQVLKQSQTPQKPQATVQAHTATITIPEIPLADASFDDIPNNNMRKVIAKRLTESKATVPHYYTSYECDLTNVLALRKKLKNNHEISTSVNDFIIKACALALKDVPEINSFWNEKEQRISSSPTVDVSVAVATPNGLITPIVKNCDLKGLSTISQNVKELAAKAHEGKLKPDEFQGGSFTISNLGMFGIDYFTAVINPPQACILAVGRGASKVVPTPDGKVKITTKMTVSLSADRRVVDEPLASQFLQAFNCYIEAPELMLR